MQILVFLAEKSFCKDQIPESTPKFWLDECKYANKSSKYLTVNKSIKLFGDGKDMIHNKKKLKQKFG